MEKQRHGFVTFWLSLMCVVNSIAALVAVYKLVAGTGMGSMGSQFVSIVAYIINIVGSVMLLDWKKIGFWLFGGVCVISLVMNIINLQQYQQLGLSTGMAILIAILGSVLGFVVLWAILQIKKDGVSCWSQLE